MFPQKPDKTTQGFTLMELLVVVTVLMLLIAICVPAVNNAMQAAKIKKTEAAIAMLSAACEQFKTDFDEYPSGEDLVQELTGYGGKEDDLRIP